MNASENTVSDEALVSSACSGDLSAFDQLILRYQKRLYSVIYNMTSNHDDTNDVLMEVFDKAFRSLKSFKGKSSFYTWIYRIAMNRAINHVNKRKNFQKDLSLNDIDMEDMLGFEISDIGKEGEGNPEKQVYLKDLQIKLNESLQKLSHQHRAVVVLFDIEGMSHNEISKIMKCSEGTVRSRLHYAHKQLQKLLSSYYKG